MTEQEYLASVEPDALCDALNEQQISERKVCLYLLACVRTVGRRLRWRSAFALGVLERRADKQASGDERVAAGRIAADAENAAFAPLRGHANARTRLEAWKLEGSDCVARAVGQAVHGYGEGTVSSLVEGHMLLGLADLYAARINFDGCEAESKRLEAEKKAECAALVREVFGNPYRPAPPLDEWRTPLVLSIARRAYDAKDFAALPVLADALEEAGCTALDLLAHLRGDGPHVRGCWALDLVLGLA